jgi:hypothetical protein
MHSILGLTKPCVDQTHVAAFFGHAPVDVRNGVQYHLLVVAWLRNNENIHTIDGAITLRGVVPQRCIDVLAGSQRYSVSAVIRADMLPSREVLGYDRNRADENLAIDMLALQIALKAFEVCIYLYVCTVCAGLRVFSNSLDIVYMRC